VIYRLFIDEAPGIIDRRRGYLAIKSIDNLSTKSKNLSTGQCLIVIKGSGNISLKMKKKLIFDLEFVQVINFRPRKKRKYRIAC